MIQDHVGELMRCVDIGIACIVVTGSDSDLKRVKDVLKIELADNGTLVGEIELDSIEIELNHSEENTDLVLVSGLEALSPKDSIMYAIRSFLDLGKHTNLRSIIFCETYHYANHFNDYDTPFYHFCFHYPIKD